MESVSAVHNNPANVLPLAHVALETAAYLGGACLLMLMLKAPFEQQLQYVCLQSFLKGVARYMSDFG